MHLRSRSIAPFVVSFAVAGLVGCGPKWTVVRQATPNPMNVASSFYVEPPSLEGLHVGEKTESEWLAEKGDDTKRKWEGDKSAMASNFSEGFDSGRGGDVLRAEGPTGAFTVRTRFDRYEPGYDAVVARSNAFIDATVDLVGPDGAVVDEFVVHAEAGGISAGLRARKCASIVGWTTGKYLRKRLGFS